MNLDDNNGLIQELLNITRAQDPRNLLAQPAGPNSWDEVGPGDFGPEHDFEIQIVHRTEPLSVFKPVSSAALQWCYRFLPANCPRYGERSFVVKNKWIDLVCRQARHDNLMSLEDFEFAMAEKNEIERQWE